MTLRASLGNNQNDHWRDDRWEQLIGRGAYYCRRCEQAWLLLAVDHMPGPSAHTCKRCGEQLTRLIKGEPVSSLAPPKEEDDRRIA